ncbi:hypothetical protein L211DRAFT_866183 [Terfezia boudieri ATCC MYA-4762]|uniref:BRCT domain-containing protein n=1 Tax=Terfezia boudieri ATCC MYA-4762 TaxID=1051890 RepID=A0A3N4LYM5_9PEZI|nr:hypothetical protein L211DRAFT_866183 [Terfezia boudieri ATCC MYA-4762]
MATNTESRDFQELRGVFTLADDPADDDLPPTQVISSSPPKATSAVPSVPSNRTGGPDVGNTGALKLLDSGSQNYAGDTQKDPETSIDGNSQSQHKVASRSPWSNVPAIANRPTSAGLDALVAELESQEWTNYFDESRRFGSPEKTQTPVKPKGPLAELTSAMRGTVPMGLTQLFNNTQDSPLQPTRIIETTALPKPTVVTSPSRAPREKLSIQTKVPAPQEDVYYSIAESQEARERRMGKGKKRKVSSRPASSSDDEELNIIFDDEVVNRRTRKAVHAKRKNDEEVNKVLNTMKASRATKRDGVQATGKKRNTGPEQALRTVTRESKEANVREDWKDGIGKKKKQTSSQKKAEERAQVIAEKRMRNRNILASTGDDTTTDDEDSPPLPRNFPRQTLEPQRAPKRSSNVQAMKLPNEALSVTTSAKPLEPFGPLDWESMHDVPRPPTERHGSFLRRKRSSMVPASDALANEVPSVFPAQLKTTKSSIKNMAPFNIPKISPLLIEKSTYSLIPSENIYQGSSSLPMPPTIGTYDSVPATSSPPLFSLMGNATTAKVRRTPQLGKHDSRGGVEVAASQPQLCTPQLRRTAGLDRAGTIPETSPIVGGSMVTPVRCPPFSRVQTESTGVAETDKTLRIALAKDTSPSKRKRDAIHSNPSAQGSRGVSVVPSSLPREGQAPVMDREEDMTMGEARTAIGTEPDARPRANSLDTNFRKRRRTERADSELQTPDHKENRNNLKGSELKPDNAGGVTSKTSTSTVKKNKVINAFSSKKARPSCLATSTKAAVTPGDVFTPVNPAPGIDVQAPEAPDNYTAHRVFALFRDKELYYHPATVLPNPNVARSHLKVIFDDGNEVLTDRCHVRRLTLQVGDVIKCSMVSMKAKLWVVIGFPENQRLVTVGLEWESKLVDTNGHRTVLLKEKKKGVKPRTSTQNTPVARKRDDIEEGTVGEPVEVPITKIYVVKSLWPQFKERLYNYEVGSPEGVDSPSSRLSVVPATETPPPKDRRASPLFPPGANSSKLLLSGVANGMNTKKILDGVFSGMIFAISFGDNEFEKKGVTARILANGGRILEQGFDEMFKPAVGAKSKSITVASTTTSIASDTEKEGECVDGDCASSGDLGWNVRNGTDKVGFACVIADKCSRRVKFLQALALGIPCLAGRWVDDCIKENMIVDWMMYLLPAGESAYLSGAIRSRILPPFSAATSKFLGIVEQRRKLFDGYNVLLVMGKGKVGEKRKPYRFLVWAMGARVVKGVVSVEEANTVLREGMNRPVGLQDSGIDGVVGAGLACQRWDFVYLDSGGGRMVREKLWTGVPKGWGRPRVVDDEWVVQSLILGKLLDE